MQATVEDLTVLLIGDDPAVERTVRAALATEASAAESTGWRAVRHVVHQVPDVGTALDAADSALPCVVLLDRGLADEAGLAALARWTRARPTIPLILISGEADEELAAHAIRAGAADYLSVRSLAALLPRALHLAVVRSRAALEVDRLNSDLIGIVSHDLRGPTGNMISYAELLLSRSNDLSVRAMLRKIMQNGSYILSLINDLLTTVRIDNGKIQLVLARHDVGDLLRDAVERCAFLAQSKGIILQIQAPPGPVSAVFDRLKVLQVINNLVSNAIKFSGAGSNITIGAARTSGLLRLSVEDRGQGIPEGEIQSLFKKFSLTSTRATRGEKGSGLGLYIVSEFMKLHRGSWGVTSEPGRGSVFTVHLPQDDVPPAAEPHAPVREGESGAPGRPAPMGGTAGPSFRGGRLSLPKVRHPRDAADRHDRGSRCGT